MKDKGKEEELFSKGTPVITRDGFMGNIVAYRPELGGYVVVMSGISGEMIGEQWVVPVSDVREDKLPFFPDHI